MKCSTPVFAVVFLSLSALAFGAEGGTETKADASKDKPAKPRDACVFSRTINDWTVIDNKTLAVWAPSRKTPYIVTLTRPATGIKFEQSLGFEDRNNDGQFCDYGGDALIIGGAIPDRITIASVRRVEPDEANRLIAEAKKPKEQPKATLPEPSDMKSDKDKAVAEPEKKNEPES
jgi:hypothetical protein